MLVTCDSLRTTLHTLHLQCSSASPWVSLLLSTACFLPSPAATCSHAELALLLCSCPSVMDDQPTRLRRLGRLVCVTRLAALAWRLNDCRWVTVAGATAVWGMPLRSLCDNLRGCRCGRRRALGSGGRAGARTYACKEGAQRPSVNTSFTRSSH